MITKRDQILNSALLLFSQQGIDNTSTLQIAKVAGVAKGTLFHHFENKTVLIDELFITLNNSLFRNLIEEDDEKEFSIYDKLRQGWLSGINKAVTHPAELKFFTQIQYHPASDARNRMFTETFAPFEVLIIEAQERGILASIPKSIIRDFTHYHFLGSASTLIDNSHQLSITNEEYIEISFTMFWNAIGGSDSR